MIGYFSYNSVVKIQILVVNIPLLQRYQHVLCIRGLNVSNHCPVTDFLQVTIEDHSSVFRIVDSYRNSGVIRIKFYI